MSDASSSLERWARKTPGALALAWPGGQRTYEQLHGQVSARSALLSSQGVAAGTVVSVAFRSGPDYVVDVLALWRSGAVVAPLPRRSAPTDEQQNERLFRPRFRVDSEGSLRTARSGEEALAFEAEHCVSALVRTSGTSGAAKGVVLGHTAFIRSAESSKQRLGLSAHDRWGLVLSPAHVGALATLVRAVHLGASLRIWPAFDSASLKHAIQDGDVTHVSVVPTMVAALLDEGLRGPIASLGCLLVGGAHMPASLLLRTFDRGLPVALTWGLTEATAQVATATPAMVAEFPGTVGLPLEGVEVDVGPAGRMGVRGATMALGIVTDVGAGPTPLPVDADGWFRTEDLGGVDEGGRIWIEGRADDVIISGGVNVSPREVEDVLSRVRGVAEAAVFGIPDDRWGQVVVALVVANASDPLSVGELDGHCRAHLTRNKCPTHIVLVDELPKTSSGKVAKSLLPELFNANN